MNPELWKLKRDTRTLEPIPHHEASITNDHPAALPLQGSDAGPGAELPGVVGQRRAARRWTLLMAPSNGQPS